MVAIIYNVSDLKQSNDIIDKKKVSLIQRQTADPSRYNLKSFDSNFVSILDVL